MSDSVYTRYTMKKNYLLSSLSAVTILGAMVLSSCAPSNPQTRIEKSPAMYERLPASHKTLVQQGQIKKGMHKDAVFLAWGRAASVTQGNKDGRNYERWIYTSSEPVHYSGISPYFGSSFGRYGRGCGRYSYSGIGFNQGVRYVQRVSARVNFNSSDKVDSWEARR